MSSAILVHGCCDKEEFFDDKYPSLSNSHWFPWLQKQLLTKGIFTQTPEFPTPYTPNYKEWKKVMDSFLVDEESILVGHSCGGGFLLRWLGENSKSIKKLILVAPWLDPLKQRKGFLDFVIDQKIADRSGEIDILISDNEDVIGVKESVEIISQTLPMATVHKLNNMGHFTYNDMKSEEFSALLELTIK